MENNSIRVISIAVLFFLFNNAYVQAQFYVNSEYITTSNFKDSDGNKQGGKASLSVIDGALRLPLSVKMDENNRPTSWMIGLNATYASVQTKDLSREYYMPEILNTQLGLMHIRPLNKKWSLMATLGAGIYTSNLKKIQANTILGQGGFLFIRHARPNFNWGAGIALNNALGYPMIFPSLYLDWQLKGKYEFKLSLYNSFQIGISSYLNPNFKLGLVSETKGLMSAVKRDSKDMYFVMQYGYAGLQPEFILGKSFSIPATAGISFSRDMYFQSKTLKSFFDSEENYPHFALSIYFSVGLKYGF